MRKHLLLIATVALLGYNAKSQNVLQGSNMEDSTKWLVSYCNSEDTAKYAFNYSAKKPTEGTGKCLRVYCASTKKYNQTAFYQKVTLKKGKTYNLKGAFKDLSSTSELSVNFENWWLEVYLESAAPEAGKDWGSNKLAAFKFSTSWGSSNGKDIDGTFQNDAADKTVAPYVVPGTSGDTTLYFGFKTGIYNESETEMGFDILVDEITFELEGGTAVKAAQANSSVLTVAGNSLRLSNIQPASLRIYNTTGQVVKMYNKFSSGDVISIADLPAGLYILQTANYSGKFIKK